jgi:hypothetical protein
VFVEELVAAAPAIKGWKITPLKPALKIENISIEMAGLRFDKDNMFFYSNDLPDYPDEIDLCIVHQDLVEENRQQIVNGVYIFLDNYLGELDFANHIDNLQIIGKKEAQNELVPISKLKDFLTWRQKEFVEKYEGVRYNTENDEYIGLEAQLASGNMLIAVLNKQLLYWDRRASHPWIGVITVKFDGSNTNGMPTETDYQHMNHLEEELTSVLLDKNGYLTIGRQTAENEREIYFACKDYRLPSKLFYEIQQKYADLFEIEYDIYKDKYWRTFERFK